MKRLLVIVSVLMLSLPIGLLADDYIDDAYYTPKADLSSSSSPSPSGEGRGEAPHQPYYDKKAMQEFVFEADTTMLPMKQDSIPITK